MIGSRTRTELESDLARALSRHIGYTTAAYDLDRIVSTLSAFENSPSAYISELIEKAGVTADSYEPSSNADKLPSDDYLENVVDFAEAMRFVSRVSDRGARLRRFAPTEIGRTLVGAKSSDDEGFYEYFLTRAVLFADADALFPIMDYFYKEKKQPLLQYYKIFQQNLRESRRKWLFTVFPETRLIERIAIHIPWLKRPGDKEYNFAIRYIGEKTAYHHTQPRRGWLVRLGLNKGDETGLTAFGQATRNALMMRSKYFWLGPERSTLEELGLDLKFTTQGPFEDNFDLIDQSPTPSHNEIKKLIDRTVNIMRKGYTCTKLIYAEQATLQLPIEYIRYRSYIEKRHYNYEEILDRLFQQYRNEFYRLSAKKGPIGYYKWRNRNDG